MFKHFLIVFNTSTFIKHKPTNRKIFTFSTRSMYKKGLGKIIHIKEDQADVFKIAENIVFFFSFYNRSISKSIDIC